MKPNQAAEGGGHEDSTSLIEHDAKEDAPTKPAFARPEEGENRSDAGAVSEAAPEPSKTVATSLRKIEANRRNALKSTGPRTASGKSRVSRNAAKHGIFSKYLLTRDAEGGEHANEYWDLHAAIYASYRPEGPLEELWVDKTVAWTWRLTRLIRCERGQIDRALAAHRFQVQQERKRNADIPMLVASHNPEEDEIIDDLFVPGNGELEKLLRYEEMISKQLNHPISELERLQARRKRLVSVEPGATKQSQEVL